MVSTSSKPGGDVIVFNFHGLGKPHTEVPSDELPYWCDSDLFFRLLDSIMGLEDETGVPIKITFDDGNRSDLEIAVPALIARGLTAEFFVCSGRLEHPAYLSAADLVDMDRQGMRIGSHGIDHLDLRKVDAATLTREAEASRAALGACLSRPIDSFAIPFGSYDRRVLRSLRAYKRVYNSDQLRARRDGQWMMPRISYVTGWDANTPRLHAKAAPAGFARAKNRLKVLAKSLR